MDAAVAVAVAAAEIGCTATSMWRNLATGVARPAIATLVIELFR